MFISDCEYRNQGAMRDIKTNFKFRKNLKKTVTIEFYVNPSKILFVRYNNTEFSFSQFWQKIPEAENICFRINEEFALQFPELYKEAQFNAKNWKETFLKFVNNHLSFRDTIMDVFMRSSGEITIHLER